ncbi:MAG TPA: 50S ribosomal protein L11 methyltransferase [Steroidobacteraceae bacterium]|nr:50S ribosomal protein L11 methyltransferase [Steroidobacteraceae bacterium]
MAGSADFLALSFELRGLDAARAEAACLALGAHAITFSDAHDDAVLEPAPGEVRLWPATRVQALYPADADAAALGAGLARELGLDADRIATQRLAGRAWEREWLRDFHARRFGRRLWVCPTHERVDEPGAVVVQLDPGLAFGTGTHPSTALCLEWLDAHLAPGANVIDYGCGSGVLGIAAARLGAASVDAFDIDPQALLATAENAAANGVDGTLRVHGDAARLPAHADVLVANILARTLCELAAEFAARLKAGGTVLLAGILAEQAEAVACVYASWFDMAACGGREGWVALAGRRKI